MVAAAILKFWRKVGYWAIVTNVANIYRCTKFEENIFIYDIDMAEWPLCGKCLSANQI